MDSSNRLLLYLPSAILAYHYCHDMLQVFLGREKKSGHCFAIKALRKDQLLQTNCADAIFVEKQVLTFGRHCPFINSLHSTFTINVCDQIN